MTDIKMDAADFLREYARMQVSTYYVLKVFGQSIMVKVIVVMITVKLVGIDLLRRLKENE